MCVCVCVCVCARARVFSIYIKCPSLISYMFFVDVKHNKRRSSLTTEQRPRKSDVTAMGSVSYFDAFI